MALSASRVSLSKLAADNGSGGVGLGTLQRLPVGYSKSYHARVAQLHGVYAAEVVDLGVAEALLGAGDACARHHIDEPVGVAVDEAYA